MKYYNAALCIGATVLIAVSITFFASMMTPRDPLAPFEASAAAQEFERQHVTGFNKVPRLWQIIASGESYSYGREPVYQTVGRCSIRTAAIQFPGVLLGWFVGAVVGLLLGANQERIWATAAQLALFMAILIPYPVTIAAARMVFLDTGMFQIGLNEHGFGAFVPAIFSTAIVLIPVTALHQSAVASVAWRSDESLFARAIGIPLTMRIRIAMSHSAAFWRTQLAFLLAATVQGSVMLENVFHVNGLGAAAFEATSRCDAGLLLLIVTMTSVLTAIGLLLSDMRVNHVRYVPLAASATGANNG